MAASSLLDAPGFTGEVEAAFRDMWRRWCTGNPAGRPSRTFLHVGCGPNTRRHTTIEFASARWRELRLDINPASGADVIASMTDMAPIATGSVDAIFSHHNIEHLDPHEVPMALKEFHRVLAGDGFAIIACPDLQSVARLIAEDRLTDIAYVSPAGPIAPIDMVYGFRPALAAGNRFMAHRTGFTRRTLEAGLREAGFTTVIARGRGAPFFDLWAAAAKAPLSETELELIAIGHFPRDLS
jgi:SAM-dependent methyltransferase